MSEYQYYEFQAVDDRLTDKEMQELRSCSSRATITPTSFTNEYNFGSFKGNADAWMEKYFDGYLYLANWGTRELQLALPATVLPAEIAGRYCANRAASFREKAGRLILTFRCEEEPDGEWLEGEGQLSSLLQIRNELAQGDLRSLYLGWLMGVQAGEVEGAEEEPPVPPGLGELSGPQANLADFFRLDPDLLAVAARNSPRARAEAASGKEAAAWIASLPAREKDEMLFQVLTGEPAKVGMELQSRFRRQQDQKHSTHEAKKRTASELCSAADIRHQEHQQEQARRAAEEKAERERQTVFARERHLDSLQGRSGAIWGTVESLVVTCQPKSYDQAVQHLVDLRDLADREGNQAGFQERLVEFRARHAAKRSLLDRLTKGRL